MRRLVGLAISLLILWLIWRRIDAAAILVAIRASHPVWLAAGLAMVIPLTLATAWRFQVLSRRALGLGQATRLILSSSTLNLVLPSKMGDIAKAYVLTGRHGQDPRRALSVVVLEKMLDMASLLVWGLGALLWVGPGDPWLLLGAAAVAGLLGLLVLLIAPLPLAPRLMALLGRVLPSRIGRPARDFSTEWAGVTGWFWREPTRGVGIVVLSLAIWAGHLAQFWLFARGVGSNVPLVDNMAFATLSILVGLAPFTMAGIGTRDAAIIFFYRHWLQPGQGAVLGVLATMRYLIPAVAGLPFIRDYMPKRP